MSRLSSLVVGLAPADRVGPGRKRYALILLLLIYTSNFIDRTIVGIVAQPMKEDLGLADWQLGLIGGLAFALFYTAMGLPIARAAERQSGGDHQPVAVGVVRLHRFVRLHPEL